MDADSPAFRAVLLVLVSFSSVGSTSPKDFTNALQVLITRSRNCTTSQLRAGVDCCQDCLGMGDLNYNSMLAILFVFGAGTMMIVGFLLDKFGNSVIVLTIACSFLGVSLEALGGTISQSVLFLPCMFIGAGFQGLGFDSTIVSRDRIIFTWLSGTVGLGFGVGSAINRLSSFVISCVSEKLKEAIGLQWTLWVAASVTLLCLMCSVGVSIMDAYATRQMNLTETLQTERESVKVTDVKKLNLIFWLLVGVHATRYSVDLTLQDNLTEFVHEKFRLSKQISAITGGSVRYIGFIVAPVAGTILDRTSRPFFNILIVSSLLIPSVALVGFTTIHPLVTVPIAGSLCCIQQVTVLGTVARLIPRAQSGIALSIAFCVSTVCSALLHFLVGGILGQMNDLPLAVKLVKWQMVMWAMMAVLVTSLCFAIGSFAFSQITSTSVGTKSEAEYQPVQQYSDQLEEVK